MPGTLFVFGNCQVDYFYWYLILITLISEILVVKSSGHFPVPIWNPCVVHIFLLETPPPLARLSFLLLLWMSILVRFVCSVLIVDTSQSPLRTSFIFFIYILLLIDIIPTLVLWVTIYMEMLNTQYLFIYFFNRYFYNIFYSAKHWDKYCE